MDAPQNPRTLKHLPTPSPSPFPFLFLSLFLLSFPFLLHAQPELESWLINTDGATGSTWINGTLTPNNVECDVQSVQFSDNYVYISATGVPRYPTAPFNDGNPSVPEDQSYLFQIPRNPQPGPPSGTATGLGHTGVLVNGVVIFNASDAFSYNNANIWHQNAGFFELAGFDCAKGHPAMGAYHHHLTPTPFTNSLNVISDICDDYPSEALFAIDPAAHSPLIGFAFDGYPIYGPFGFDQTDGTGGIVRMETSYQIRDITNRHTLADGTTLNPNQWGPDIGALVTPAIPPGASPVAANLGAYIEDYEFVEGSGHLDIHNGRFCVTPEYPDGTYAYFATVDADWNPAFPYFFDSYYGEVVADNFGNQGPGGGSSTNVTINEPVETYNGSSAVETGLPRPTLQIHPNPAATSFQIAGNFKTATRLDLVDLTGKIVSTTILTGENPVVAIEGLKAGLYLVQITGEPIQKLLIE
jgi:hypothetical protein